MSPGAGDKRVNMGSNTLYHELKRKGFMEPFAPELFLLEA